MKTIIAATDFSSSALTACKYAALVAQRMNCRLTIFNIFDAPLIHSNVGMYGITYNSQRKESTVKSEKLVKQLEEEFPKIRIDYFVTNGEVKNELEEFTSRHLVAAPSALFLVALPPSPPSSAVVVVVALQTV